MDDSEQQEKKCWIVQLSKKSNDNTPTAKYRDARMLRMQMCPVECKCECGFLVNANVDFLPLPCKCAVTVRREGRWVEIITGKCLRQIHKFSRNPLNFDPSIISDKTLTNFLSSLLTIFWFQKGVSRLFLQDSVIKDIVNLL